MSFKIGDVVRFIDQVGEGKVKQVLIKNQLIIEDQDGFEYTVLSREVLKIEKPENESLLYEKKMPTDHEIFNKDVDEEKLKKAQNKFNDLYQERVTIKQNDYLEVDLHIHKLVESTAGMGNGDMLDYQIRHFERMMKIAERKKVGKVVFIHGVGEGVLRSEIRKLVDQFYPNCHYREGNPREYGSGATEVRINNS